MDTIPIKTTLQKGKTYDIVYSENSLTDGVNELLAQANIDVLITKLQLQSKLSTTSDSKRQNASETIKDMQQVKKVLTMQKNDRLINSKRCFDLERLNMELKFEIEKLKKEKEELIKLI